jgi:uncharacterized protein (TIGR04255 family)
LEAVCEFRFPKSARWDITIPGLIYERLKDIFPKKQSVLVHEIEMVQGPEGLRQQFIASPLVRFSTEDEKTLVQVGPHLLAVNKLKPYTSWDNFRPIIQKVLEAYFDVVEDVIGFERIGLRYINRIELDQEFANLEDYFEFRPYLGMKLQDNFESFILSVVFGYNDGRDKCKVHLVKEISQPRFTVVLDIDYFLAQPKAVSLDGAMNWIDQAHDRIKEIFEGCITDKLREKFEVIS